MSDITEVFDRIYAAWAAGDADAFVEPYAPDAVVVMPGGVFHRDREEIRAGMRASFAGPLKGSRAIDTPDEIRYVGPDTAVVVSTAGILLAGETEVPESRLVRAVWVLVKQNAEWRVASYVNTPRAGSLERRMTV